MFDDLLKEYTRIYINNNCKVLKENEFEEVFAILINKDIEITNKLIKEQDMF